jgi:Na+-transporting NADH:ubiquinone oxidoreductase subunit C
MVIAVAALLSFASISLKTPQNKNIEIEKKINILASVNKAKDAGKASNKNEYVEREYGKYIVNSFCVNIKGEKTQANAFTVDLKAEFEKPEQERNFPVFVSDENGAQKYIFPVRGAGLWGAIWGYVALNDDFKTVYGATFDHKGETPGLGAEIANVAFQKQFGGKSIYDGKGKFTGIYVIKPGSASAANNTVDGISGGTITSKALEKMVFDCLLNYKAFFTTQKPIDNDTQQ